MKGFKKKLQLLDKSSASRDDEIGERLHNRPIYSEEKYSEFYNDDEWTKKAFGRMLVAHHHGRLT
jgi:hypothetical protein